MKLSEKQAIGLIRVAYEGIFNSLFAIEVTNLLEEIKKQQSEELIELDPEKR